MDRELVRLIAVDVVYIALYIVKGLWMTGALYLLFIALCIGGYRAWRNHLSQATPTLVEEGAARPSRDHSEPSIPADR